MVVSWSPNPDAQYFHVAVVSNTGARLYCNSSTNSCSINNLPCGQDYNVTVISVRDACESKPSAVVATSSGKHRLIAASRMEKYSATLKQTRHIVNEKVKIFSRLMFNSSMCPHEAWRPSRLRIKLGLGFLDPLSGGNQLLCAGRGSRRSQLQLHCLLLALRGCRSEMWDPLHLPRHSGQQALPQQSQHHLWDWDRYSVSLK